MNRQTEDAWNATPKLEHDRNVGLNDDKGPAARRKGVTSEQMTDQKKRIRRQCCADLPGLQKNWGLSFL